MDLNLAQALRLLPRSTETAKRHDAPPGLQFPELALVGAGGKTTALFQLARLLPPPVIVTTTHLGCNQVSLADSHWFASDLQNRDFMNNLSGILLVTGAQGGERFTGINEDEFAWLHKICAAHHLPLLVEADGPRRKPLKAPAEGEPVIPQTVDSVVVVAGLAGLGKPLAEQSIHQPDIFSRLSGMQKGEIITTKALGRVLMHPAGGLKNIPPRARRIALLNQADTPALQSQGKALAEILQGAFHAVVIASLRHARIFAVHEPVAGIILAAGGSTRYGSPKQLLQWHGKPFIRSVAEAALTGGLSPLIVVIGAHAREVEISLQGLPLHLAHNPDWQSGQAASIRIGMDSLRQLQADKAGAAVFLLADQPQVPSALLTALREEHARTLAPILAPMVAGRRANPVLFDRSTFADLMTLQGDVGGRSIFNRHQVQYLPWQDETLLLDVDTPQDYLRLCADL